MASADAATVVVKGVQFTRNELVDALGLIPLIPPVPHLTRVKMGKSIIGVVVKGRAQQALAKSLGVSGTIVVLTAEGSMHSYADENDLVQVWDIATIDISEGVK